MNDINQYEAIEQETIKRLAPLKLIVKTVTVNALPETEAENELVGKDPIIYVCYRDSEYADGGPHGSYQSEEALVEMDVRARKLRGAGGCYHLLQLIRVMLLGFRPYGGGGMVLRKSQFIQHKDGAWQFVATYSTKILLMAVTDEDEVFGILKSVSADEEITPPE